MRCCNKHEEQFLKEKITCICCLTLTAHKVGLVLTYGKKSKGLRTAVEPRIDYAPAGPILTQAQVFYTFDISIIFNRSPFVFWPWTRAATMALDLPPTKTIK